MLPDSVAGPGRDDRAGGGDARKQVIDGDHGKFTVRMRLERFGCDLRQQRAAPAQLRHLVGGRDWHFGRHHSDGGTGGQLLAHDDDLARDRRRSAIGTRTIDFNILPRHENVGRDFAEADIVGHGGSSLCGAALMWTN